MLLRNVLSQFFIVKCCYKRRWIEQLGHMNFNFVPFSFLFFVFFHHRPYTEINSTIEITFSGLAWFASCRFLILHAPDPFCFLPWNSCPKKTNRFLKLKETLKNTSCSKRLAGNQKRYEIKLKSSMSISMIFSFLQLQYINTAISSYIFWIIIH